MISVPAGVRIYLALEPCDMRKGFDGLSLMVQQNLGKDPFSGHLFLFRGKRSDRLKILYADANAMALFSKRLAKSRFVCPRPVKCFILMGGKRKTTRCGLPP